MSVLDFWSSVFNVWNCGQDVNVQDMNVLEGQQPQLLITLIKPWNTWKILLDGGCCLFRGPTTRGSGSWIPVTGRVALDGHMSGPAHESPAAAVGGF